MNTQINYFYLLSMTARKHLLLGATFLLCLTSHSVYAEEDATTDSEPAATPYCEYEVQGATASVIPGDSKPQLRCKFEKIKSNFEEIKTEMENLERKLQEINSKLESSEPARRSSRGNLYDKTNKPKSTGAPVNEDSAESPARASK